MRNLIILCTALALAACSESGNGTITDGGGDVYSTSTCPGGIDKSVSTATAVPLAEGKEVTGFVCPRADKDYYKITLPAAKRLMRIKLMHTVPNSGLELTYQLLDAKGRPVGGAPPWTGSGVRRFDSNHCLQPGDYFLQVYESGNDFKDGLNPYKLSYETLADPDKLETNDTVKQAKAVSGQAAYISCKGDVDYYKVNAPGPGKILELKLQAAGTSEVDLKYSVMTAAGKLLATDAVLDGSKTRVDLLTHMALPAAGDYLVKVEDEGGDDSDPKTSYTLSLRVLDEPDKNDATTRNDTGATATKLGSFSCTGGTQTFTVTGAQIATRADVDYYKVVVPDCGQLVVMEATVDFKGASKVDPQVAYVYPHDSSYCKKDSCCRVLNKACTSFISCLGHSAACITKGDTFCKDKDCQADPTPTCPQEKRCAGAVTCLPGNRCGAELAVRQDKDGSDGAKVKTALPLIHSGGWYLRVNDLKNDDYDLGKPYTLTVRLRLAPDGARELDSQFFSETVPTSSGIYTYTYHQRIAAQKGKQIALGETVTGTLSYEGDQDWYRMKWPCDNTLSKDCILKAVFSYSGSGCPKGSKDTNNDKIIDDGLEFVFTMRTYNGAPKDAFPKTPTTGVGGSFGYPNECFLFRDEAKNPDFYFSVADLGHNMWSWDCTYTFTLTRQFDGCPVPPCKQQASTGTCYVQ
jgi:hypothetical protein